MKKQLQHLVALQEVDVRLEELADQQRRIPEKVEAARQPLLAAQARLETVKGEYERVTRERKAREDELATQEQAISKMHDREIKGEIKTNKEYQAHKFEIDLAKTKKGEIEERLLILMEQVDVQKKDLARAEAAVKEAERSFAAEKQVLESSVGALDAELADLGRQRQTLTAEVEAALLRTYERLRETRKGQALAGVTQEGTCMACRLHIQPQVVADVKRARAILTCTYCHRILYWIGEPAPAPAEAERSA